MENLVLDPINHCTSNDLSDETKRASEKLVKKIRNILSKSDDTLAQANAIATIQKDFFDKHDLLPMSETITLAVASNAKTFLSLCTKDVLSKPDPHETAKFIWEAILVPQKVSGGFVLDVAETLVKQLAIQAILGDDKE